MKKERTKLHHIINDLIEKVICHEVGEINNLIYINGINFNINNYKLSFKEKFKETSNLYFNQVMPKSEKNLAKLFKNDGHVIDIHFKKSNEVVVLNENSSIFNYIHGSAFLAITYNLLSDIDSILDEIILRSNLIIMEDSRGGLPSKEFFDNLKKELN